MMKKITVLGAGLVGTPLALDLANDYKVTAVDINEERLNKLASQHVNTVKADVSDVTNLKKSTEHSDFVVNALPGFRGYEILKTLISFGKKIVDISFFPEDTQDLETLALQNGATAVFDCGVAPGMSNMLSGYLDSYFDTLEKLRIYVGGLPQERVLPWEYKAVFSPADVLEEYTRTARFVRQGKVVYREALTDIELLDFPVCGTLEAFNTDGLRSLIKHIDCPDMIEKTLRYPGYAEKIKLLKQSGFLSTETVPGQEFSPLDFTSRILFPAWELKPGDQDLTVMQVSGVGLKNGQKQKIGFKLLDYYDKKTAVHSMARTTGYTATATLRMMDAGLLSEKGFVYPEMIGKNQKCLDFILADLKKKNIEYQENLEIIR